MNRRQFLKKAKVGSIALAAVPVLGNALAPTALAEGGASHVRWDTTFVDHSTTPPTIIPGGVDMASADASHTIALTGSGTFVAPASGGTSSGVTGGGTWETFDSTGSTGSGTYEVTKLASFQFANLQTGVFIDPIPGTRANGNAVLLIAYSDGSEGILGVGCEGPGAPEGIQEGVIATKGYFTYWTRTPPPPPSVSGSNRTLFHLEKGG